MEENDINEVREILRIHTATLQAMLKRIAALENSLLWIAGNNPLNKSGYQPTDAEVIALMEMSGDRWETCVDQLIRRHNEEG